MTVTEIVNVSLERALNSYGILPRSPHHWYGIVVAPFLHGSAAHYGSNIVPLIILSFFSMQHGILRYLLVSCAVIVAGGFMVWLLGRPAVHIGASGLIYGYLGFCPRSPISPLSLIFLALLLVPWWATAGAVFDKHCSLSPNSVY